MSRIVEFVKDWMLPIAIIAGITICLILRYIPSLASSAEPMFSRFAKDVQPIMVAIMLFLQFNKVSPKDLRFRKWHAIVLTFQTGAFLVLSLVAMALPSGEARILVECAMLCFVCPTAAAAGVITDKLGGSLSDTVTYVVIINIVAALVIPLIIPMVHPVEGVSFMTRFASICARIFPLLVFPLLLAWLVRYTMRKLHQKLVGIAGWAFYIWGFTLCLSIYLATRALIDSGISIGAALLICVVSLVCALIQFFAGRRIGLGACESDDETLKHSHSITAGQAFGQKNNGFLIWLGYTWMTPVSSVAGGLYSIWQNLVNSWELYEQRHHPRTGSNPGRQTATTRTAGPGRRLSRSRQA
ncbi:MAG: transporter [Bacteroidales bacterium]|nr:transporter [Bacteroidales bacterium]